MSIFQYTVSVQDVSALQAFECILVYWSCKSKYGYLVASLGLDVGGGGGGNEKCSFPPHFVLPKYNTGVI